MAKADLLGMSHKGTGYGPKEVRSNPSNKVVFDGLEIDSSPINHIKGLDFVRETEPGSALDSVIDEITHMPMSEEDIMIRSAQFVARNKLMNDGQEVGKA